MTTEELAEYDDLVERVKGRKLPIVLMDGIGAAALVTGVVLMVTSGGGDDTAEGVSASPMFLPGGGGMTMEVTW